VSGELSFEWFLLILRLLLIFLLYFFIFQVIRVVSRELRVAAGAQQPVYQPPAFGELLVIDPGQSPLAAGERFLLDPVTVIGRHPDCTIPIDARFISSEHAQLTWDHDQWWVVDLGSTNGTLLNGRIVRSATQVQPNDVIELAGLRFQLVP
jgi:hypothetical protein